MEIKAGESLHDVTDHFTGERIPDPFGTEWHWSMEERCSPANLEEFKVDASVVDIFHRNFAGIVPPEGFSYNPHYSD